MNDDQIKEMLQFDPLTEAEKLTGKTRDESDTRSYDFPVKVDRRVFNPCAREVVNLTVSLRPNDDTRHVYVSGHRSGTMILDIETAKSLGHALLQVASEAERRKEHDDRHEEYRRQTQGQRSELLRQLNELGW